MKRSSRSHSIVLAPVLSFFSKDLYRDVARHWRLTAFVQLLLVLAICWIPFTIGVHDTWSDTIAAEWPAVRDQIPPITIAGGRASCDVEQPYRILSAQGETILIIDTTGEVTDLDGLDAQMLLTETKLIARRNQFESREYELSEIGDFYVDGHDLDRWVDVAGRWSALVLYPFFVGGSFVYRVVQALLYSLLGVGIARVLGCGLTYPGILGVTLVALTPAIVLKTAVWWIDIDLPLGWLIYFAVAVVVLTLGLGANAGPEPTEAGRP